MDIPDNKLENALFEEAFFSGTKSLTCLNLFNLCAYNIKSWPKFSKW